LIIAPPNVLNSELLGTIGPMSVGFASGWMTLAARRRGLDAAFTLSDHADWPGLNAAIAATGAQQVFATHGYTRPFRAWLESQGFQAGIVGPGMQE
ncbi:MAG: DNA ligase-associated DEXH box helicase, partial [Candidatus Saccharibacteria bacterium]|nr:DNA ligase-associated DEXH box helicase [Pseudorhodobacter sp.]